MNASRIGSLVLAACCVLPAVGHAQEESYPPCTRTPTEADVAAAKGAFQAGRVSFDEAEYERAITYWQDAYRRDCTATGLLLNLSRAYELNGNLVNAVHALEEYLARNPDTPQRAQLERRVAFLRERLEQSAAAAPPSPESSTDPVEPETTASAKRPEQEVLAPPAEQAATEERPLWPLFVAGGGGLIAIVGSILYFDASSDVSEYRDLCRGSTCPDEKTASAANDAASNQTTYAVVTVGGLAVLGGGLAWYFLGSGDAGGASGALPLNGSLAMTPLAGPQFGGLELRGAF